MELLASRDISKHLDLTWSVRDELEAMEACTLVSALRAKDERFQPNFIDLKLVETAKTRLKKYCALLDRFKFYEETSTLESWTNAAALCQTNDKVFSKQLLEYCQVQMAKAQANAGALVDSADLLKQILLNNGKLGQAWAERGKAFLAMEVPLLAQVHFAHPSAVGIHDIILLQQRTQDLITRHALEMSLQQRREALEHIPPPELFARAQLLLWQEEFAASAAIYFAACLRGGCNAEQRVHCLLNIAACWRRKRDEAYADRCIQLCNLAWRIMDKDEHRKLILMERARGWLLKRQFAFALDDLNQIGVAEEDDDDDEVKRLKQRCNRLLCMKSEPTWTQQIRVAVVSEQHQQPSTRHELFGGIPNEPIVPWNVQICVDDLRYTSVRFQASYEKETAIPCVYVSSNFVSFPAELDYVREENLDEDVLWTWGKVQAALEGMFQSQQQQQQGLSSLLLREVPLHKFTTSSTNRVDLQHCTCVYDGEFADWEFTMDNELKGIVLPVGKRVLKLEQTMSVPIASPPPPTRFHTTTVWMSSCAIVAMLAIGWAAIKV